MTSQTRGIRTFFFFIFRAVVIAGVIFIAGLALFALKGFIISSGVFNALGVSAEVVNMLGNYLVGGIFSLALVVLVVGILYGWLSYITFTFMVDEFALRIKRGILDRTEISIPYRQIQDVDLNQNLLFRIFGLATLAILTAGTEDDKDFGKSEAIFDIIDSNIARVLQKELLSRAEVQLVKNVQ